MSKNDDIKAPEPVGRMIKVAVQAENWKGTLQYRFIKQPVNDDVISSGWSQVSRVNTGLFIQKHDAATAKKPSEFT